jgi:hypothetical protein
MARSLAATTATATATAAHAALHQLGGLVLDRRHERLPRRRRLERVGEAHPLFHHLVDARLGFGRQPASRHHRGRIVTTGGRGARSRSRGRSRRLLGRSSCGLGARRLLLLLLLVLEVEVIVLVLGVLVRLGSDGRCCLLLFDDGRLLRLRRGLLGSLGRGGLLAFAGRLGGHDRDLARALKKKNKRAIKEFQPARLGPSQLDQSAHCATVAKCAR